MKKWKTVFAVLGATLALSAICGVAYLRESSHRGGISPQLAKASLVGQGETQRNVGSAGTMHDYHASGIVDRNTNPQPDKAAFAQKTRKLQMPFIANNGQVEEQVKFYAKTFGGTVFVTKDGEIVYALPKTEKSECRLGEAERTQHAATPQSKNLSDSPNPKSEIRNQKSEISSIALREEFVGARVKIIQGEDPSVTKVNYFKGNDPSKWKTNVSTYDIVSLGDVYDGIELKLKAYGNNVEKLFCVKPGADPEQIKISLSGIQPPESPMIEEKQPPESPLEKGARGLWVNEDGQLVAETELGPVKFTKPIAYQEIDGKRMEVDVEYSLSNPKSQIRNLSSTEIGEPKSEYGFTVASYDHTKPLIIDPLLASTYLGGSSDVSDGGVGFNPGNSLALDTSGNVYVTGRTDSTDFPTTSGAYGTSYNGGKYDVFISKLNGGLTSLLASTYLGGSDDDSGSSLALDTSGNVYVTGLTDSSDFPTTSGAYDTSYNDSGDYFDVFISKLDGGLTSLLASTYLGGSKYDFGYSLALGTSGDVYVAGRTDSTDFPTTSGAYGTSYNGGKYDVFISKLNGGLTSLLASTYLGGSDDDSGSSLVLDTSGNVYVTGDTESSDFPTTRGAYDIFNKRSQDVFVSKLDSGLTSLLASTYLGGFNNDVDDPFDEDYDDWFEYGLSLTLDTSGNVYVTGLTASKNFPTTSGAYDTSDNGDSDVFISKLDGGLTSLLASTYLGGGHGENWGLSLTLDTSGNVYVTGLTDSKNFPTTSGAYDTSYNGDYDVFISKLDGGLTSLLASTYLGGSSVDFGHSLALDTSGNVYVTGLTDSKNFPTTSGAYDTSFNGVSHDVFVLKLDSDLSASGGTGSEKGIINGSVVDTGGNVIESVKLTLTGKKGMKEKTTDNTGSFEFTGLDAGTYKITAKKKGYKTAGQVVKLKKGEEKKITITMKTKK